MTHPTIILRCTSNGETCNEALRNTEEFSKKLLDFSKKHIKEYANSSVCLLEVKAFDEQGVIRPFSFYSSQILYIYDSQIFYTKKGPVLTLNLAGDEFIVEILQPGNY